MYQLDTHTNTHSTYTADTRADVFICRVKDRTLQKNVFPAKIPSIMLTLISVLILAGNHLSIRAIVL